VGLGWTCVAGAAEPQRSSAARAGADPGVAVAVVVESCTQDRARLAARVLAAALGGELGADEPRFLHWSMAPDKGPDELAAELQSARGAMYRGRLLQALSAARATSLSVSLAPPDERRWSVKAEAMALEAQLLRSLGRTAEASTLLARLAAVDSDFRLDAELHPPSLRQAFESARRRAARAATSLALASATAGTADVYVEGRRVGPAPASLVLPPGEYLVRLTAREGATFPRRVVLARDAALTLHPAETRVARLSPACARERSDGLPAPRPSAGVTLELPVEPRSPRLLVVQPREHGAALALFDHSTGAVSGALAESDESLAATAQGLVRGPAHTGPSSAAAVAETAAPEGTARRRWWLAGAMGVTGVGLVVAGGLVHAGGGAARTRLAEVRGARRPEDPVAAAAIDREERALAVRCRQNDALTYSLIGVGATAVAGAALIWWLWPAASVAVGPAAQGVAVSGTF
jgi:hypothetical protein